MVWEILGHTWPAGDLEVEYMESFAPSFLGVETRGEDSPLQVQDQRLRPGIFQAKTELVGPFLGPSGVRTLRTFEGPLWGEVEGRR